MALQPDHIEALQPRPLADGHAVWDHVVLDPRHPADHGVASDPDELMDRREPADDGAFLDDDMATERRVVGHDDPVADGAVVGDVGAHHEQAVIANPRDHPAALGARVHGHVLAHHIVRADDQLGRLAAVFNVLRPMADRGEGIDLGPGPDLGPALDDDMTVQNHVRAQIHMGPDHAVRPDFDPLAEPRLWIDDGGGVNLGHQSSMIMAVKRASAMSTPSTRAWPLNFQTLPRRRVLVTWIWSLSPGTTGLRNRQSSMDMK